MTETTHTTSRNHMVIGGRSFQRPSHLQKKSNVKVEDSDDDSEPHPPSPEKKVEAVKDDNEIILDVLTNRTQAFDNSDILLEKIRKRMDFGKVKYGHGIIIADDTKKYSNNWDECSATNWLMMAYEEMLDGCVYFAAELLRARQQRMPKNYLVKIEKALKYCIKSADLLIDANMWSKSDIGSGD